MLTPPVDGILNVDKPSGITSMEVVRRIKRFTRQRGVGHAGTLDPHATGVLPICFGQATRLMEYLINSKKTYRTILELGVSTDTYDVLGSVTGRGDYSSITLDDIQKVLGSFQGTIDQVPPMYSALKKDGQRLYALARSGVEVKREARKVHVFDIKLLKWDLPFVTLEVDCGRGVYIRALGHDIGERLGCGACLKDLVRLRSGPFDVSDAVGLSTIEEKATQGDWKELLYPPDYVLQHMRAAVVGPRVEDMIVHGRVIPQSVRIPFSKPGDDCRVYTLDGRFLAILTFDASRGHWRPLRVFPHALSKLGSNSPG